VISAIAFTTGEVVREEVRLVQRRLKATWKGGVGGTGMFPSHGTSVSGEPVVDLFDG
jgi:hypothetical protein